MLFTNPLEQLWTMEGFERPHFNLISTANYRGYVAIWAIKNDELFLRALKDDDQKNSHELIDIFPETMGEAVKAWWYTGTLRIPKGKCIKYTHGGYARTHETEIYLTVRRGTVKDKTVKHFTKEDFEPEISKERAEKLNKDKVSVVTKESEDFKKGLPHPEKKTAHLKKKRPDRKNERAKKKVTSFLLNHPDFFLDHMSGLYPLSSRLIEKHKDTWDWGLLSENPNLPWSDKLIRKYEDKWSWGEDGPYSNNILYNEGIDWTSDRFNKERYRNENHEFWLAKKKEDPEKKKEEILSPSWSLSDSEYNLKYTRKEMEEKFENPDWEQLSNDRCVPWTEALIDRFIDKWEWGHSERIVSTDHPGEYDPPGIVYQIIHTGLSYNPELPWSEKMIQKYSDRIFWHDLTYNEGLPWSISLIKKFSRKWLWDELKWNTEMWKKVFYPYLDEETIDTIVCKIVARNVKGQ
ncbi:MAG: hypothetical protein R6V04_09525 [bacterium]